MCKDARLRVGANAGRQAVRAALGGATSVLPPCAVAPHTWLPICSLLGAWWCASAWASVLTAQCSTRLGGGGGARGWGRGVSGTGQ